MTRVYIKLSGRRGDEMVLLSIIFKQLANAE
jgi:hypothetical protein